jgi:hypothetical protein
MTRVRVAFAVLALAPASLAGQKLQLNAGAHVIFGDYKETAAALHYQGGGAGFWVGLTTGKLSADGAFAGLSYKPVDDDFGFEDFKATQLDARLRYYIASGISAELGMTSRKMDPEFAAQSASAARVGLRAQYLLGPGASLAVRGNYLAGGKFSGGGKAAFGLEVGLGLSVGATNGRWRVTADYEFQRFNRTTTPTGTGTEAKVPLQQALARVGAALGF